MKEDGRENTENEKNETKSLAHNRRIAPKLKERYTESMGESGNIEKSGAGERTMHRKKVSYR